LAVVKFDTGCEKLAVIEENIVTAFNEVGGDNNNVITVTLNRAYRVCAITLCKEISLTPVRSARDRGNIKTRLPFFLNLMSGEA
jgi:hypothetical protein